MGLGRLDGLRISGGRVIPKRLDSLVAQLDVDDLSLLADRIWLILEGLYATAGRPDAVTGIISKYHTETGRPHRLIAAVHPSIAEDADPPAAEQQQS